MSVYILAIPAMEDFKTPSFSFTDPEGASKWSIFKEQFENFLIATKRDQDPENVRVAILLKSLEGTEGLRVYKSFNFLVPHPTTAGKTVDEFKKITAVLKNFDEYFKPKTNQTMERYMLSTRSQAQDEPFESFLVDIHSLVATCDYGKQEDSILTDRIVLGVSDPS